MDSCSTVFFHVANSDIICFSEKFIMRAASLGTLVQDVDGMCGNYKDLMKNMREDIKECKVNKISVDGFETLMNDFCVNEDMKTTFINKKSCFFTKISTLPCMPKALETGTVIEKLQYDCKNQEQRLACLRSGLGKGCDAESLVDRFTNATKSFNDGWCAEVNGASVNKVLSWSLILGVLFFIMFWEQKF